MVLRRKITVQRKVVKGREDQIAKAIATTSEVRAPLSRERVLDTAIGIADRDGVDALTMRGLAQELGVEAMSLYHYVRSKDELLKGMLAVVLSEIEPVPDDGSWREAVRKWAVSSHDAYVRHRWAHRLTSSPESVLPAGMRNQEKLLKRLREAGFSPNMTHHAFHALDSHIIGTSLWEAGIAAAIPKGKLADVVRLFTDTFPIEEYPFFHEHVQQHLGNTTKGDKSVFEFGLDLILDGLERIRAAEAAQARRPRRAKRAS